MWGLKGWFHVAGNPPSPLPTCTPAPGAVAAALGLLLPPQEALQQPFQLACVAFPAGIWSALSWCCRVLCTPGEVICQMVSEPPDIPLGSPAVQTTHVRQLLVPVFPSPSNLSVL